jgi:DNA helicase-2/ATP-dependent DNA helicase PcrA
MQNNTLNQPQQQAIKTTEGPLLVLAGAGTGKTKVLTSRIVNILNCGLANPYEILAVTFTNKAANEMKHRISAEINDLANGLWIGTFHAICAKILRRHAEVVGLSSDFIIIDDEDQLRLIRQILLDLNIDGKQFPPKYYLQKISKIKDTVQTSVNNNDINLPKLQDVYRMYQSRLLSMNATDFGNLISHNLDIFAKSPEILKKYQQQFRYILIDEYQDTNNAQYQWLLLLSKFYNNICCVGDDDQSIYSWRGANIANILRFEKDFVDAKVIRLEQNYRSTSVILQVADAVISKNTQRHGKTLWTTQNKGDLVKLITFYDDRQEAQNIVNSVKNAILNKQTIANQIAILVRAGYQTRPFEEAFMQQNVSYRIIGGLKFYDRQEIRDCIAYLRLSANLNDDLALLRVINTPKRGIGDATLQLIVETAKQQKISMFNAIDFCFQNNLIKNKSALQLFMQVISKYNQQIHLINLAELAKSLFHETNYYQHWKLENTIESQGRLENIEEFIKSLADFSSVNEFLEYASLVEAKDEKNLQDAVNIMTVHGAKGLEFEMVFLPGLEEGIFPSSKSLDNLSGVEEERRLLYVAITRAKKYLQLSLAKNRFIFGGSQQTTPSRFLQDIPKNQLQHQEINLGQISFGQVKNNNLSNNNYGENKIRPTFSAFNYKNVNNKYASQKVVDKTLNYNKFATKDDDFKAGKKVEHNKFGFGIIIKVDGNKLEINFDKSGVKTIMQNFVKLVL